MEGGGCEPPDVDGVNVTGYQGAIDAARKMADTAMKLKMAAIALMVIGAILIGFFLTSAIGYVLLAIGAALLFTSKSLESQAKGMGDQIAEQFGQQDQGAIVQEYESGGQIEGEAWKDSTVGEDVAEERDSGFSVE